MTHKPALLCTLVAALSITALPARAENTVVVELFTSQGCSSCPAADAILRDLKSEAGLIPLSLNVDYWDYLGWKDDLALPSNAKRQRAYARALRSRHVYTPQMMVDGRMDVVGSRRSQVDAAIATYSGRADTTAVTAEVKGGQVNVSVSSAKPLDDEAVIWLIGYDALITKAIGGGENRGRSVDYANVVREWREAARWDGKSPLSFSAAKPAGDGGLVVIVQRGEVGPILGAAQMDY